MKKYKMVINIDMLRLYLPLLGGSVSGSLFGRFLGSEGSAIMITTCVSFCALVVFIFGLFYFRKKGPLKRILYLFLVGFVLSLIRIKVIHLLGGQALPLLDPILMYAVGAGALLGPNGAESSATWEEDSFELDVLGESFSSSKTDMDSQVAEAPQTEEGEPSVNQVPQEAGASHRVGPYQDQGLATDRNGNPIDLNDSLPPSSLLYGEIESSASVRARDLELEKDIKRVQRLTRNFDNAEDPARRLEVAARLDPEVRELDQKWALFQEKDALRARQIAEWRETFSEDLAAGREKEARLALLNSWLKVIIHTRNNQPPQN